MPSVTATLEPFITRWGLERDGEPFATPTGVLQPVLLNGARAMLKVATHPEERRGAATLAWFAGQGAVRVLAGHGDAQLLERATCERSLSEMAESGRDDEATVALCTVVEALHGPRVVRAPNDVVPLERWFRSLFTAAARQQAPARIMEAASVARALLDAPIDERVLHGDVHHANVLWHHARGWLAIDPKGLFGERTFDYANMLCNPVDRPELVRSPGRLERQTRIVAVRAGLSHDRVLRFLFAYAALSACWSVEDGLDPSLALSVLEQTAALL